MSGIKQRTAKLVRGDAAEQIAALERRAATLEEQVATLSDGLEESRRLNERLSDVLDLVTELLVPAVDRDDERLEEALARLGKLV